MSSDSDDGSANTCPKCGTILEPYGDDGAECPNDDCGWIKTRGFEGTRLDDSWSNGPWDNDGETVGVGTEDDDLGESKTSDWSESINCDPDELTDKRKRILRAVGRYPNKTAIEIAEMLGIEHESNVYKAVKKHWPEKYDQICVRSSNSPELSDSQVEAIRRRALNGESAVQIAEDYANKVGKIRDLIRGDRYDLDLDIPPLTYNNSKQQWEQVKCEFCGKPFGTERQRNGHYAKCSERNANSESSDASNKESTESEDNEQQQRSDSDSVE
jgi:hypothetical protein